MVKGAFEMRSPLTKRIFREIRDEAGKYIVIALFMIALISVASGYFIADASLKNAYDESFGLYNIEDGNLELAQTADEAVTELFESEDTAIYPNFYKDEDSKNGSTLRIFSEREEVNKVCLLNGSIPEKDDEIALDRLYMKSNSIAVGDTLTVSGKKYKIVGTIALPDYSALYENNTDFMFDTEKFGVGTVTKGGFERLGDKNIHYSYSWKYNDPPKERFGKDAYDKSDDFLKAISKNVMLLNYIPTCRNSAIKFSGNDLGHDRIMMIVLLYMLIVIISFVFAVTTSNTIAKEANVIGTLRASGYTKGEIILHYMAPPVIVLAAASIVGNILGYTLLKDNMADMYLGSYSLVSYETLFNADAFIETTIIPIVILCVINLIMLISKLSLSPLKFLRRDLKRHQRRKALRLNTKLGIMTRFRLRVFFQNITGYLTIFVGIFFASTIMVFCLMLNPLLDNLAAVTVDNMIAQHQYILKMPVETELDTAEKYSATSLKIRNGDFTEDISVYGITKGSRYYHSIINRDTAEISSAFADKYSLKEGDKITLHDEFGSHDYSFTVSGIYNYPGTLAVFIGIDDFAEKFDKDDGYFTGYFSDKEITDIDDKLIAGDITEDDYTKTSRQLKRSMGGLADTFVYIGIAVIILVVYMLSKVIIEKNSQSISVTKILGYSKREIGAVYIRTTTVVTILSILLCVPLVAVAIDALWRAMMMSYAGWLAPVVPVSAFVKTIALAIATYIVTSFALKHKINKIPLDEALKNVE